MHPMTQDQIIQLCRGFQLEGFDGQAAAILTLAAVLAGDVQPDAKPLTVRQAAKRLGVSIDGPVRNLVSASGDRIA
jgi:hypothetical protein